MPFPLEDDIPEPPQPFRVGESGVGGGRHVDPDTGIGGEQPLFRPHAFALTHGDGGAMIAYGELHYSVTIQNVTRTTVADTEVVESITQEPIKATKRKVPQFGGSELDPEVPNVYTQLDDYGDVYLYWEYEVGSAGVVSVCEIRVGEPDEEDVAYLNEDLEREPEDGSSCTGKFAIKIGRCVEGDPIEQYVSSDVNWHAHVIEDDSPCGGSSASGSSSESSPSSQSSQRSQSSQSRLSSPTDGSETPPGGSKSNAILPYPHDDPNPTQFVAWATVEAPEVLFIDWMKVKLRGRVTSFPLDDKTIDGCEVTTITPTAFGDRGFLVSTFDGHRRVQIKKPWWNRSKSASVLVVAVRKGFLGVRHDPRTGEEFEANKRFWSKAQPEKRNE